MQIDMKLLDWLLFAVPHCLLDVDNCWRHHQVPEWLQLSSNERNTCVANEPLCEGQEGVETLEEDAVHILDVLLHVRIESVEVLQYIEIRVPRKRI